MTAEPDALRLVPVEPTEAMLWRGFDVKGAMTGLRHIHLIYRAMIAAAPVSPDSDLLKEAVGLLKRFDAEWNSGSGWAIRMDDLSEEARAFLSKVEERG